MAEQFTGITITFQSGFFAEIKSASHNGIAIEILETTHAGTTTARTFEAATLADWGELEVEMFLDPSTKPAIGGAAGSCVVTFPSGDTWTGSAILSGFSYSGETEQHIMATATAKFSGDITVA